MVVERDGSGGKNKPGGQSKEGWGAVGKCMAEGSGRGRAAWPRVASAEAGLVECGIREEERKGSRRPVVQVRAGVKEAMVWTASWSQVPARPASRHAGDEPRARSRCVSVARRGTDMGAN